MINEPVGGGGGGGVFQFLHPFTALVSGPSSCGKTYLIKDILQSITQVMSPPPQKIIWLYKRWQPLYDEIQTTVIPEVEFVQGVPLDLDKDTFIDPAFRHLVIIDDLMSTKDPRITDLFTEGSHQRNLSVMVINQNLYFSRDPTQRRNCHYLILFNNPIDRQLVTTLARQMYPDNIPYFIIKFDEAINKKYGCLLIDLKPTTGRNKWLLENVLPRSTSYVKSEGINTDSSTQTDHCCTEMSYMDCRQHLNQTQNLCSVQKDGKVQNGLNATVPQWYFNGIQSDEGIQDERAPKRISIPIQQKEKEGHGLQPPAPQWYLRGIQSGEGIQEERTPKRKISDE